MLILFLTVRGESLPYKSSGTWKGYERKGDDKKERKIRR